MKTVVESWGSVETRMGHKETVLNTTKRKVKNGHLALNFLKYTYVIHEDILSNFVKTIMEK